MSEFIKDHSIKIAIGTLAGLIVAVISFSILIGEAKSEVKKIPRLEQQIQKIPVLENDITTIKDDVKEIKGDIKLLLKFK